MLGTMGFWLGYVALITVMLFRRVEIWIFEAISAGYLGAMMIAGHFVGACLLALMLSPVVLGLHMPLLQRRLSDFLLKHAAKNLPKLSKTEEEALNTGDTWLEKSIFLGDPDWTKLFSIETALTAEEQSFLDTEVVTLCAMLHEWDITQRQDLPEAVWSFIRSQGFLGLVIPKEYGGKGFSARAHSDIVMKIATRSTVAAVTVMVPNSLGPGELLYYYGTEAQKQYYLPRLAQGLDIPCFALTEPEAGSDATSIQSTGQVVERDGELGIVFSLEKRWITLSSVATLIGVAIRLKDDENLLDGHGHEGLTCLLIPRDLPGLEIGNRHLPANQPFINGTIRGRDLYVPITYVIGGQAMAGRGWQMLVECLSIGRSISLPALGAASSSVAYVVSSAYVKIRRQFHTELAQFEGIQEKLAQIGGLNYIVNATRLLTIAAVNEHKKPSVASAITKYFNTELARQTINDAMDIHGGRAVVMGPRNYLMNYYQGIPISVTVEGANIMTRNLLIFGQGSMACHPYIRDEFYAMREQDADQFHVLCWNHVRYHLSRYAKAVVTGWTLGYGLSVPKQKFKRYYQHVERLSAAFSWVADLSLIYLGGTLKRKERMSARLGDMMSYLYLSMGVLRLFESQGQTEADEIHAEWALQYALCHTEQALVQLCHNFPSKGLGRLICWMLLPWGRRMHTPSDALSSRLARTMSNHQDYRAFLKNMMYLSGSTNDPIDRVELAFQSLLRHAPLYQKVSREKGWMTSELNEKLKSMVAEGTITEAEMEDVLALEKLRWDAMWVDEFEQTAMKQKCYDPLHQHAPYPWEAS